VNGEIDRVQKGQGDWAADEMRERAKNYDREKQSRGDLSLKPGPVFIEQASRAVRLSKF
jgi:hypothetical protein